MIQDGSPDLQSLGLFVRERRMALALTQTQLADRLGWVQERISLIERGKYGLPSLPALSRLGDALGVTLVPILEELGFADRLDGHSSGGSATDTPLLYTLHRLLAIDALTLKGSLDEASDLMAQAMGAEKADAFLYDASSESLVALGTSNTPMGRRQHELGLHREPLANGHRVAEVYTTGESFYTSQADKDPRIGEGTVKGLGVRSQIAVPLRQDGNCVGVLVADSSQPDRFSPQEREFFEIAAHWVAMVGHRAELMESMTRAAAEQARRGAADELITLLAHDLGNALAPVKGRIDLLRRRVSQKEPVQEEDLQHALYGIERMQRMIAELLDAARLDRGLFVPSLEMVDLVALVEEVVAEERSPRVAITTRLPEELFVSADAERIVQVLSNLLNNAVHHTPEDTPILVEAAAEKQEDGSWAVVSVHDEGPGIEPELLPDIFGRFSAGPGSSGLGLGLFLARTLVEAHGGTLTVSSSPGQGTTFSMSLPRAIAP